VFRAVPPRHSERAATAHDRAVRDEFALLIGGDAVLAFESSEGLTRAARLPLRLGGLALTSARVVGPLAFAAGEVQITRLLNAAFPDRLHPPGAPRPGAPAPTRPAAYHSKPSGRPAGNAWDADAPGEEQCKGAGRCHMPPHRDCAHHMCQPCCALRRDGACSACRDAAATAARELEAELSGVQDRVRDALRRAACAACDDAPADAPIAALENAFVLAAAAYRAPQRAVTCALNGFSLERLLARLPCARARYVLESAADRASYAVWLAAPVGRYRLPDVVARLILRRRMHLRILRDDSRRCVTTQGRPARACTLNGVAGSDPYPADAHAMSCKNGGMTIRGHNTMRNSCVSYARSRRVQAGCEARDFLPDGLKIDVLLDSLGAGFAGMGIDLTGRFGALHAQLEAAENEKVLKYSGKYRAPVLVQGFAFNDLGALGPSAHSVVRAIAAEAERAGAGHLADLRFELYVELGIAHAFATHERFAWFAHINNDRSLSAPVWWGLQGQFRVPQFGAARIPLSAPRRRLFTTPEAPDPMAPPPPASTDDSHAADDTRDAPAAAHAHAGAAAAARPPPAGARATDDACSHSQTTRADAAAAAAALARAEAPLPRDEVLPPHPAVYGGTASALLCPLLAEAAGVDHADLRNWRARAPVELRLAVATLHDAWRADGWTPERVRETCARCALGRRVAGVPRQGRGPAPRVLAAAGAH
jgi:hypothetical protein